MPRYICETRGMQYAATPAPPEQCPVCEDERQYVGWNGQTWTTHEALAARYKLRVEDDDGLLGVGLPPDFAIPQRALLLPTDAGNILWECVSVVTDEAVAALNARGGVDRIIISHPHFYSSMVEWSEALSGVPSCCTKRTRHGSAGRLRGSNSGAATNTNSPMPSRSFVAAAISRAAPPSTGIDGNRGNSARWASLICVSVETNQRSGAVHALR